MKNIYPRSAETIMVSNMIVKHYAGSRAYGTALPSSDVDVRGIFCADPINIRTPFFPVRECTDVKEEDTKYYELAHFMKLCLDCNPNIIETLWVDEEDIIFETPAYEMLRENRGYLLSTKLAHTFSGYAYSQLKRIIGHNKFINQHQPEEPPKPYQFLTIVQWFTVESHIRSDVKEFRNNYRFIPYGNDMYGVYPAYGYQLWDDNGQINANFEGDRTKFGVPVLLVKYNKEVYKQAKEKHEQYWAWKKNRNEVRSELEEKYGYDTKHAMHLVRLMRMGIEALRDGKIIVKRPDAEELLSIRNGAWTYDEIINYANEIDYEIKNKWYNNSILPKKPDIKFAARLLMDIQDSCWVN